VKKIRERGMEEKSQGKIWKVSWKEIRKKGKELEGKRCKELKNELIRVMERDGKESGEEMERVRGRDGKSLRKI
jgi:hypothetical protein